MVIDEELNPWNMSIPLMTSTFGKLPEELNDFTIHALDLALDSGRIWSTETLLDVVGTTKDSMVLLTNSDPLSDAMIDGNPKTEHHRIRATAAEVALATLHGYSILKLVNLSVITIQAVFFSED